jgi:DNA-binding NarL/FixJ family response regulator
MFKTTMTTDDIQVSYDYVGDQATDTFVALIECRPFLRECIGRGLQFALSVPVLAFSTLSELDDQRRNVSAALVILSLIEASSDDWANALKNLTDRVSRRPVVMLASTKDSEFARAAILRGAKGYIPVTMGFEIGIAAIRFVLVGGTYAPTDYLLAPNQLSLSPSMASPPAVVLTDREISVVGAIKQGKSNKIIAYELNLCESTVKVHMRKIMKKLNAKNRTEVAMMT